jgi:hypothetical protein
VEVVVQALAAEATVAPAMNGTDHMVLEVVVDQPSQVTVVTEVATAGAPVEAAVALVGPVTLRKVSLL